MNRKLKILFFSSGLAPEYGGAAISEASLCRSLEQKCSVQLLCRQDRWNRKFLRDFSLESPIEFTPKDFYDCWRDDTHPFRNLFQSSDVVHLNGHWRWEYFFIARLCKKLNIPYVLHPRGMMLVGGRKHQIKRAFNFLLGNHLARGADRIIALSHFETKQMKTYEINPEKISVIPNGVCGLSSFEPNLSGSETADHFLYFGRLEHRKNILFLLEAYAQYLKKGGNKKLRLKGPIEHGYEQLIHKKVQELNISHHVSVLAPSYGPDKWRQLSQAIAVVYPCLDEPFGRVPFETVLSDGLPLVPEDSGGAEYLKGLIHEAVYSTHSVEGLSERLFWAEALSLEDRKKALKKAKSWVQQELEWSKISELTQAAYQDAISQAANNESSSFNPELVLSE